MPEFGGALVSTGGTLTQYTGYKYFLGGELRKPNAIDVTAYRTLKVHARSDYASGKAYARLAIGGANAQEIALGATEGIYSIDLSAQTGLRYLGCYASSSPAYLYDWWLE